MNIHSVSRLNFGQFNSIVNMSDIPLTRSEEAALKDTINFLNKKQSNHIDFSIHIQYIPEAQRNCVRFVSQPLQEDIDKIRQQPKHANATTRDYLRKSKWFPIHYDLKMDAKDVLDRQIKYIGYCLKDPEHSSQRINIKRYSI